MKSRLLHTVLLLAALLLLAPPLAAEDCTEPPLADPYACLELLLEYDPVSFDIDAFNTAYGTTLLLDIPELQVVQVEAPDPATRDEILANGFAGVIDIHVNSTLINPECRQRAIGLIEHNLAPDALSSQSAVGVIRAAEAWPQVTGAGVVVLVADTGVDPDHPRLSGRLEPGVDLVDGDGQPRDEANGVDDDGDGMMDAGYGHGTAMASLIAAVAPDARLLAYRIADDECHTDAMLVSKALVDAVALGVDIVNLSFGMLDDHRYVDKALRYAVDAGVTVVLPTGNSGLDREEYPSRGTRVVAVSATDDAGIKADFANFGSAVDLVAPGIDIVAAYPDLATDGSVRYVRGDGSSYSAALVSGVAALAAEAQACTRGRELGRLLGDTATPVDDLPGNDPWRGELGDGLVDASAIVTPGLGLAPLQQLLLSKLDATRIGFHWLAETAPGSPLGVDVVSVERADEVPFASNNQALCPGCPAASLALRCQQPSEASGECLEPPPGSLEDPARVLYYQALASCSGVQGLP